MICPSCRIEARIKSNEIVKRKDGTLAYRIEFECRNKQCPDFEKVIETQYDPIEPIEE
jgi:NMD protein affecting ribosome stability and mRNA decay